MLKTFVVIGVLAITPAVALAQTSSGGPPGNTPGHQMQNDKKSTAPGASEFAPGHQRNSDKAPGHSESAPGQKMKSQNTGMPNNPRAGSSGQTDSGTGK
jgi:hypothetical protein